MIIGALPQAPCMDMKGLDEEECSHCRSHEHSPHSHSYQREEEGDCCLGFSSHCYLFLSNDIKRVAFLMVIDRLITCYSGFGDVSPTILPLLSPLGQIWKRMA
jgi:hypothetical protein